MSRFYVERRAAAGTSQRFEDLAFHLQLRYNLGITVVVVQRPRVYVSMLARAWTKVARQLRHELAIRLGSDRGPYLREYTRTERIVFVAAGTAKAKAVPETAAVILVAPDDLTGLPASYCTLYILDKPPATERNTLEEQLISSGLLVEYVSD
jgi:hypothetical protein